MMDLDNIRSSWQAAGSDRKDQAQLLEMTRIRNHPEVKRMRTKFIIEGAMLLLFTFVYYDGFDGETKPMWANIFLISMAMAYILVRFAGWLTLRNMIREHNLRESLLRFKHSLKRIATWVLITSFLFGVAIISFFSSVIVFTDRKYYILIFMAVSLVGLTYLSARNWIRRVRNIDEALAGFRE